MLDANKLQQAVDQAYTQFHSLNGGQNADYIPFLANVPGQLAAVAIVTCDGNIYRAGDSDYRFALESISKVCTLALALEDVGPQAVQDKVGADPTGLPFNSVIALELHGGKPLSPLVNAGAIATTSLINAENAEQRWQRILHIQQQLAGEQVALSDEVNQSEQTTNFHNRAIAWLLYSAVISIINTTTMMLPQVLCRHRDLFISFGSSRSLPMLSMMLNTANRFALMAEAVASKAPMTTIT
jgi:glutaminase